MGIPLDAHIPGRILLSARVADRTARTRLSEGLVITIEPVIAAGTGRTRLEKDGWTFRTEDGSLSAHFEHTVVIARGASVLLTGA